MNTTNQHQDILVYYLVLRKKTHISGWLYKNDKWLLKETKSEQGKRKIKATPLRFSRKIQPGILYPTKLISEQTRFIKLLCSTCRPQRGLLLYSPLKDSTRKQGSYNLNDYASHQQVWMVDGSCKARLRNECTHVHVLTMEVCYRFKQSCQNRGAC